MKRKTMKTAIAATIFLVVLTFYSAIGNAAGWSDWATIDEISVGSWKTYFHTDTTFDWGRKHIKVDADYADHNRILSLAMLAVSMDLRVRFYCLEDCAIRIELESK